MSEPRYAIYFVPEHGSALERFGASVIGYDCHTGQPVDQTVLGEGQAEALREATEEPRRYGFHATLKPPFRLAPDRTEADLIDACLAFAATLPALSIGPVGAGPIDRFIALTPKETSTELILLAAECVASLDRFRAPLSARELARRRSASLTGRQEALLARWGYPYVFDQFRFHMTLTGGLDPAPRREWLSRLTDAFAPLSRDPVCLHALTILRQDDPESAFVAIDRARLAAPDPTRDKAAT